MSNTDQIAYWNGQAGEKWVRHAERLDALLEPFADEVLETGLSKEPALRRRILELRLRK